MKTSELTGAALDWAVAKCEQFDNGDWLPDYSTDWAHGGSIIEREKIALHFDGDSPWVAECGWSRCNGATPLEAAMRCYVVSKLGDEVHIPEEITT